MSPNEMVMQRMCVCVYVLVLAMVLQATHINS